MSNPMNDVGTGKPDETPRPESSPPAHELEDRFAHWGEDVGRFLASAAARVRHLGGAGERAAPRSEEPTSERTATQRAEVLVNDFSDWTKRVGAIAGRQLSRVTARAREEAEDIWAEARAIRHHDAERAPDDEAPAE